MTAPERESTGSAIGRIPSGLFILTTLAPDGAPAGMLVSWVQQSSFAPPLVSVALGRDRSFREIVESAGRFALSILGRGDRPLAGHFTRAHDPGGKGPFEQVATEFLPSGLPVLKDALAFVECRLHQKVPAGDHVIYFGEVVGGCAFRDGEPATHWRRSGFSY
jgi:flavin reductase (DIM6/NTAB) family NADH-FMN oxidoreductase RutF